MQPFSPQHYAVAAQWARQDLYFFSRWLFLQRRGYLWQRAPHHRLICDALMRVFRGECRRLIINIPPRYSKTELAVVNFVAWALAQVPDAEFIHVSYAAALASHNSAAIRSLMQHEAYRAIAPHTRLARSARSHWSTTAGGVMYATGAGGTITGFGAGKQRPGFGGAILIDDPHKPDEARSDTTRQGVIDWFQNTLESRKNRPDTPVILIMQRLHEHDLSGWLLDGGNGEAWEHLCLPALQDDGHALWPERHDVATLQRMAQAAPYTFAGQYQQQPAPPAGLLFKPDQVALLDAVPAGVRWVRAWDLAATAQGGDWTVGAKLGALPDGRWLVGDLIRLQGGPDQVEAAIRHAAQRDGPACRIAIPQDPGQAGKAQVAYLSRQLAGFSLSASPVTGDKLTRAEPLAAQLNVGNVLLQRAPWNDALLAELRLFPNARHDDQVDALSLAFAQLSQSPFGLLDHYAHRARREPTDPNPALPRGGAINA
ncbi:phage terminase large subunit [Leeia aquatica]|uniref:Phage terminase large subunit n=1 Tax=Leeia aquatica TaxID=2725557 RepID=A0A847RSN7_9NEIS|nr:phage terminase large subunit [Leeia aquatica]NLR74220.1 phage terminase large subunit [Leeia aquatica]